MTQLQRIELAGAALQEYNEQHEKEHYVFQWNDAQFYAYVVDGFPEYDNGKLTIYVYSSPKAMESNVRGAELVQVTVWEEN